MNTEYSMVGSTTSTLPVMSLCSRSHLIDGKEGSFPIRDGGLLGAEPLCLLPRALQIASCLGITLDLFPRSISGIEQSVREIFKLIAPILEAHRYGLDILTPCFLPFDRGAPVPE